MTPVNPEILQALSSGIQSEVATYVFYLEAARNVKGVDIKETLEQLAGEEKTHFQILERQYDSLVRSEKWISTADILKKKGLPEINEDMTSQHKELIGKVRRINSRQEILKMALQLEVDSRDLFKNVAAQTKSSEAREVFQQLSRFEEGHINLINSLLARD